MKILITLYDLKNIEDLSQSCDGFIIGNEQFAARLTHSFSPNEINEAIIKTKNLKKEIFLQANQMLDDELLKSFDQFLNQVKIKDLTGIITADIGGIMLLKSKGFASKAIYNPETLLTNYYDFNFLNKEGILGAFVAKEITLLDVLNIAKYKKIKLFMFGHGHLNMFYSKRQLLKNFMEYNSRENIYHQSQELKIIEEQRREEPYPILEDRAGTHVFRSQVFSSLNYLKELENHVDYLVIDTIFKDDRYGKVISNLYRGQITDDLIAEEIRKKYQETWDEGFLHKKTVYKTKEL